MRLSLQPQIGLKWRPHINRKEAVHPVEFPGEVSAWPAQYLDPKLLQLLNHVFAHTAEFYDYYFKELDLPGIKPNAAHLSLARLEDAGMIKAVITQNIDGLHQAAGSRNVIELHGTVSSAHCVRCNRKYDGEEIKRRAPLPKCDCGGLIKPDVVLYGESLDGTAINRALEELEKADLVIVGGTSLAVYPAAGFLRETSGKIAVINKEAVAEDRADIVILGNIAEILPCISYIAHR